MKKVGVIWIGHADYLNENTRAIMGEIECALKGMDAVSVDAPHVVASDAEAVSAARALLRADLSGAILVLVTWVECSVAMSVIKELRGLPAVMWGFPIEETQGRAESTGSYVSAAMLSGVVKRLRLRMRVLIGSWRNAEILRQIEAFARAASAMDRLFYARIGLFGYTSMSIYPGTFDHALMRYRIGPEIEQMDAYTLIRKAESIPNEEIQACIRALSNVTAIQPDVLPNVLDKTMALYAALKKLSVEHGWAAVNVKCQYEFSKEYRAVPCVALSMLADDGVVASCEGDIPNTVSMLLLNALSGRAVTYGDAITHYGNTVQFSPCGFLPPSMGQGEVRVQKFMEHPGFSGIQISGVMQLERVTFLRLVEDVGEYHILYGTGMGQTTKPRGGCMPALDVKLDGLVQSLCAAYAGQHFALAYGDLSAEIEAFAAALGLSVIRV